MKHCLWELCETQYNRHSVFEDFEGCAGCMCLWGEKKTPICVCPLTVSACKIAI